MQAASHEGEGHRGEQGEDAGQALKARLVARLAAHLAAPRDVLARLALADLLIIAGGVVPAGHS